MSDKTLKFQIKKSRETPIEGQKSKRLPPAPKHFQAPERQLWRKILRAYVFDDEPAALALLQIGLEAHERARACREAIARIGPLIKTRAGDPKPNPLLIPEHRARCAFQAAMHELGILKTGS